MNDINILSIDFEEHQKGIEIWKKNREYRAQIYNAIGEYIEFSKKIMDYEKGAYQKCLIEKRIKKLKKLQEDYYDPCILATKLPGKKYNEEKEELEHSKSLIKRIFNKKI